MKDYEILKEVVKFLEKRCKEQKKRVEDAQSKLDNSHYCFDDEECLYEDARLSVRIEQGVLNAYVRDKVSIEKYYRKLRHNDENSQNLIDARIGI